MRELFLIHIYGPDRPGLMAHFCGKLAAYEVDILDMGQSVIHDTLSLSILAEIPPQAESAPVIKDLLFAAHNEDVTIRCTPIEPEKYARWVEAEGRDRHIVTLLARRIKASQVAAVAGTLADNRLNIEVVTRLTGRPPLDDAHGPRSSRPACIEFSVRGRPSDPEALRKRFLEIAAQENVDIALQADNAFRRIRRLVAFDMDSTLLAGEFIDELAAEAGVGDQVSAITAAAMRGELDFSQSLRRRLGLLAGMPMKVLEEVMDRIQLNEGAEELLANLKRLGLKTAIISGGFTYVGERLARRLGIDYVFANELEIRDGRLTGNVVGEIVDAKRKAELLHKLADREGLSLQQTIAVGDGANDLPMLNLAGLGIAFHAKPAVKAGARQAISTLGLDAILYLIGVRERDLARPVAPKD